MRSEFVAYLNTAFLESQTADPLTEADRLSKLQTKVRNHMLIDIEEALFLLEHTHPNYHRVLSDLFSRQLSELEVSKFLGLTVQAVNYRKQRALKLISSWTKER